MALSAAAIRLGALGVAVTLGASQCNSPYPSRDEGKNILYTTFDEAPKHLDPAQCYVVSDSLICNEVMEPPFQYHYLKRPFALDPLTATAIPKPEPRTVVFAGKTVEAVVYTVELKPGTRYQDHPCFVEANRHLTAEQARGLGSVWDLPAVAARELVAADYAYAVRRLADPRLACPVFETLADNLLGMAEFRQALEARLEQERAARRAAAGALYNQEQDEKLRPIHLDYSAGAEAFPFIRAVDHYHFEVVLRQPYPQILYWMAMGFFAAVPHEALEFYDQPVLCARNLDFDHNPVGTGAYVLRDYDPSYQIVLERNRNFRAERYPSLPKPPPDDAAAQAQYQELEAQGLLADAGKRLPMIDRVVYRMEKESIPRWNKFLQGYYDTSGISNDLFDQAVKLSSQGDSVLTDDLAALGIRKCETPNPEIRYGVFNMQDPVIGGLTPEKCKLRQAVSIAYDSEEEIAVFLNGRGVPAHGLVPPGVFGHEDGRAGMNPVVYRWDDVRQGPVRRDLDEARKLLAEAGYPNGYGADGKPLTLTMITAAVTPERRAELDFIRKQFAKLNIRLDIQDSDFNRFQDRAKDGTFQVLFWGWVADYPDPENFLFLLYGPNAKIHGGGENYANYEDPEYDRLFLQMRSLEDTPQRLALIRQMLALIRTRAPLIFDYHPIAFGLQHAWYGNFIPHPVAYNTLKYKRIDAAERTAYRAAHNQPRWQPVAALVALLLLIGIPAVRIAARHLREV